MYGTNLSSTKQRRYRHTQAEWESRRERIIQLYVEEGKTADEVVETLKSIFSFRTG
jgi:DNA-binding CsgD family transcriptional regulator